MCKLSFHSQANLKQLLDVTHKQVTAVQRVLFKRLTLYNEDIEQYLLILLILNLSKDDSADELSDKEGRNELRDETAAATELEGNEEIIAFKHYSFRQRELA